MRWRAPAQVLLTKSRECALGRAVSFNGGQAHCWLFQETLLADLRECLEAWEQSHELHAGVVNWTHFEAVEKGQVTALTDKSKSVENAKARHGECTGYNPGLSHVVRKTDRMLFDKFGFTTCCGKRTAPMED